MQKLTFDRTIPLAEQRLRVALAKSSRIKKKNHGTGKRNAAIRRAKKKAALSKAEANLAAARRIKAVTAAYWRGEAYDLSGCYPDDPW